MTMVEAGTVSGAVRIVVMNILSQFVLKIHSYGLRLFTESATNSKYVFTFLYTLRQV